MPTVRACVRACMCVCVCVRARVCVYVCECVCVRWIVLVESEVVENEMIDA